MPSSGRRRTGTRPRHGRIGARDLPDAHVSGAKYWIIFVDYYSRFVHIKFLKFKSQAKVAIMLVVKAFKRSGIDIQIFHTDYGGEFISKELTTWAREQAIEWEYSAPYAHPQDAIAERYQGTIVTRVRAVLAEYRDSDALPCELWAEIVGGVVFVPNLTVPRSLTIIPFEMRYNRRPNVRSLRALGTTAWVTIPEEERAKKRITKMNPILAHTKVACWDIQVLASNTSSEIPKR